MHKVKTQYAWAILTGLALLILSLQSVMVGRASPQERFWNFGYIHLGALCLEDRCDPFDSAALNLEWKRRNEPWQEDLFVEYPVYPPSTLLLAASLNELGWPGAGEVFTELSLLAVAGAACLLCWRMRTLPWAGGGAVLLATLGSKFFYDALWVANPVVFASGLVTLAALGLMERPDNALAAAALAAALCVKPQLAVGATAFFLWRRPTRRNAVRAVGAWLLFGAVACLAYRLRLGSWHFVHQFAHVLKIGLQPGHSSDASRVHRVTDYLNLETATSRMTGLSVRADKLLAAGITVAMAAAAGWVGQRRQTLVVRPWSMLALLVLVSLLPVYHRDYDRLLALLLVPAAVEMKRVHRFGWLFAALAVLWVQSGFVARHLLPGAAGWPSNALLALLLALVLLWSVGTAARRLTTMGWRQGRA